MKRNPKRTLLAWLLTAAMLLSLLPTVALAADAVDSGTCGDDLTWTLDEDGVLTISGTGDMTSWSTESSVPWYSYCSSITQVVIESGVTNIGNYAFRDCTALTDVTIPDSVTSIGYYAFQGCIGLTSVTIPGSVTIIDAYAFRHTGLTSVTIGNGVTNIGEYAFDGCTGLTSVTIPDSVTSIGSHAFYGCTGLTDITIGSGVTSIGISAFYNTGFYNDESNWKGGVLYLGSYLLEANADALEASYTIKEGTTAIADYAFYGCTSLTGVTIPDSVTSIGSFAFYDCTGLTSMTIGSGVTSIGISAFYNTGFYSDESNWEDGVLYLGNYLLDADADSLEGSYAIREETTVIAASAFSGCTGLTSVTIPDSVTSIGSSAFRGCTGLTSVTIPDSVSSIGGSAFYYCTGLTSVTIGSGVTSISSYAFDGCASLTDAYYSGSESDWAAITIGDYNDCLTSATIHYSGVGPDEEETHTHSYTATVTKAATCTETGVRTYTCSCGASYTETIPATGHTWNSGEVTTPATRYTEGEKTYTCTVCGATRTETIAKTGATFLFTDVTNTATSYYTPVYWAYDYGITTGTTSTTFSPSATCTRAQFVTFLWRLAGEPEPSSGNNPFTDVTNTSASYYKAVLWAVEQGVTKGTSDTTFSPSQTITRAQAVTFLYRYAGEPTVSASSSFTDVTNTSASYYKAVIWAVEQGITNGTTSTTFSPSNPCTRGQMVTFLYRFAVEPLTT